MRNRIAVHVNDSLLRQALVDQIDAAANLEATTDKEGERQPDILIEDGEMKDGRATLELRAPEQMESGAAETVHLPVHMSSLLSRIRARLRQQARPVVYQIGPATFRPLDRSLTCADGQMRTLADKVSEFLACLCEANGRTVSRAEVLDAVWGYPGGFESHTIDTHAWNLRTTLREAGAGGFFKSDRDGYRLLLDSAAQDPSCVQS